MIYVTGDTHGNIDIHKFNTTIFPEGKTLTKDDYVIVCGDFGLVWNNDAEDKWWQKWLENKPWTTLFVDGNHENHKLLNSYPVEDWHGGKVHKISDSIIHLMRGQIYEIEGQTFFTMGGALSIDKHLRVPDISWWEEEIPNYAECEEGFKNLEAHNWKVDYIITHTGPEDILKAGMGNVIFDPTSRYLSSIMHNVEFKHWYFGHMHIEKTILNKYSFLYWNILKLGDVCEN